MLSANEALQRLKEGNRRFVAELGGSHSRSSSAVPTHASPLKSFSIRASVICL